MELQYKRYQNYLGKNYSFLKEASRLPIMARLKYISILCGMDYATPYAYHILFYISRLDHSMDTAKITYRLTKSKREALIALFHDACTPVFSHVIDYVNGDFLRQESTEEKQEEIILSSKELQEYLKNEGISVYDLIDFKSHSIVDYKRPHLCADRISNTLCSGFNLGGNVDFETSKLVIDHLALFKNEEGKLEIGFSSSEAADAFLEINERINQITHSSVDHYMMLLLAKIVKHLLDHRYLTEMDLYTKEEFEVMMLIEEWSKVDETLRTFWYEFKHKKVFPEDIKLNVKDRIVRPIVLGKRYNGK